jgi:phosphate transport system protein
MLKLEELEKIEDKIKNIFTGLINANQLILDALNDCDANKFGEAKSNIKNVSNKTNDIDNDIIKVLALYAPEARDLRQTVGYFKVTNELVRAAGNTRSFIKGFTDLCVDVDKEIVGQYLIPMQKSTVKALTYTMSMIDLDCGDDLQDTYNDILIEESKTNDFYEMVEKSLDSYAQLEDKISFEKFHNMLKTLRKSEKIADRAMSMANLMLYIKVGGTLQN